MFPFCSPFVHRIRAALEKLNDLIDESDPDIDLPNIIHAFQSKYTKRRLALRNCLFLIPPS